jgi:hypothetical protein
MGNPALRTMPTTLAWLLFALGLIGLLISACILAAGYGPI